MKQFCEIVITELTDVLSRNFKLNECALMQDRPSYGISYAVCGSMEYIYNDKSYILRGQNIVFLPYGATYKYKCIESGEFLIFNFRCTDVFYTDEISILPLYQSDEYVRDHEELSRLHCSIYPFDNMRSLVLAYRMILRIFENAPESSVPVKLRLILKAIESNYNNPDFNIEQMANTAYISEVYLRKLFQKSLGISPKHYLQQYRLNKSKLMLLTENCTINEIALKCGYTNQYHYCRAFKTHTGMTPSEYRKLRLE